MVSWLHGHSQEVRELDNVSRGLGYAVTMVTWLQETKKGTVKPCNPVTEWSLGYVVKWLHSHEMRALQCVSWPWLRGYDGYVVTRD
mgnify:CR=1 FL=1